uniref:Secreted protein n=1 Tax=Tanacetum cinerariifolium TaxID=118510 RepID=A0A6L2P7I8_TANCI|nr:hypothetical protein [Tanacetum cinerariifolium]
MRGGLMAVVVFWWRLSRGRGGGDDVVASVEREEVVVLRWRSGGAAAGRGCDGGDEVRRDGFPAQSVGSSNTYVLELPFLLVLITGTSQSRQHGKSESDSYYLSD